MAVTGTKQTEDKRENLRGHPISDPCAKIIPTKAKKTMATTQEILLYIPTLSLLLRMTRTYEVLGLKSMHLDGRFLQAILDEEVGDLGTLVSLELDDLTHFLIFDESAVASEFLRRLIRF